MARDVPEWIGRDDNEPVPVRVKLRVYERFDGRCGCCTRKIYPWDKWDCDHVKAIINNGENRESNLQPLLDACHKKKTSDDVAEKSKIADLKARHLGIKPKRKWRWG